MDQSGSNKASAEQLNSSTQLPPTPGKAPPPGQFPFNPFHNPSNETSNENWYKIQSMMTNSDMRVFLQHDFESKWESIKCYEYYRIILYFNPATKSRPNHKKSLLYKAFKDEVYPILKPHVLPVPPTPMDTEQKVRKDFNPLSRRVRKDQLVTAVLDSRPVTTIPKNSDIGSLLYLYREHVDKDLKIPGDSEFVRPPNVVHRDNVKELLMEELRMSLQEHAPHVFIHSTPMSHTVLVNLYIKFVLDEPVEPGMVVRGFHYSLLRKTP
ncbi:uncharacterized protein MELLADRAFT_89342 [Melampsora larici-populina 98AG31]|uniref:Uncharacterized protein n=1 Tax=Melampsora larici-populina (strain 98AG31 / pathotype 3-4-7) TaxID=747676 RepID=F4R5T3_MELLP|nr:uncharacterized protein MELLADRAFT_89342 [Melampsora larici-populina 98AG31]EGG12200.1 hypothetical protein MELLADRAFT_89342 [Melampsora larici-populina 98AG31]